VDSVSLSCKTANIKIYPQILGTEARFYIYDPPMTDINAIAKVWRSGVEFAIKFCCFKAVAFTAERNLIPFCFII